MAANRLSKADLILGQGKFSRSELFSAMAFAALPMMLIVRITLFMRQRGGDFSAVDTHAMAQILLVALTGGILLVSPRSIIVMRKIKGRSLMWLLIFYAICAASAIWGQIPQYSFYRAVEVLVQLAAIWVALSCFKTFSNIEKAALLLMCFTLLSDFAGRAVMSGFSSFRTNTYSSSAGMLLCYCFGEYVGAVGKRRKRLRNFMLIAAPLLVLGHCSTSNLAAIAGMLMVGLFKRGTVRIVTIILLVILLLLVMTGLHEKLIDAVFSVVFPEKTREQVAGMSGRVGMWKWALGKFAKKPFLGHGFLVTGRLERNALTMHNSFIGSLLDTGLLGTTALAIAFMMAGYELFSRAAKPCPGLIGCIGAFSCGFVNCMGVPFLATHWSTATFAFAALSGLHLHTIIYKPRPAYMLQPAVLAKMRKFSRSSVKNDSNQNNQEDAE